MRSCIRVSVFRDSEHFYRVIGKFMEVPSRSRTIEDLRGWWGNHPSYYEEGDEVDKINSIGRRLRNMNMILEFRISNPDAIVTIDAKNMRDGENYSVIYGKSPYPPDLVVQTTGDIAHLFWGGKISVPIALMTGKIRTNGSRKKALQLLPKITPAFSLYPRYLELIGEDRLLQVLKRRY